MSERIRGGAGKGARGGIITLLGQLAKIGMQFGGVIVLARLLDPATFGLAAMLMVFVGLSEMLRDLGITSAALQARRLSAAQASNLFWVNSAMGLGLALLLCASEPAVEQLYDVEFPAGLIPLAAVVVAANGVQAQYQVQLARAQRYTTLVVTDVSAQFFGLFIAILAAASGAGVWALIFQQVAGAALLLILRVSVAHWMPSRFSLHVGTRPLLVSALHLGGSSVLNWAAGNVDTIAIGARLGDTSLGIYNRAFQLLTVPISKMLGPLTQVVVPSINQPGRTPRERETRLLQVQGVVGVGLVWLFMVATVLAPAGLPLLLGPGWDAVVPVFQVLAIGGSIQVFSYVSFWGFLLSGASRALLSYSLVSKTIAVALVLWASQFGIVEVAGAYAVGLAISWPLNLLWLSKATGQRSMSFFLSGTRLLLVGAVSGALGLFCSLWLSGLGAIAASALGAAVASGTYLLVLLLTRGGRADLLLLKSALLSFTKR